MGSHQSTELDLSAVQSRECLLSVMRQEDSEVASYLANHLDSLRNARYRKQKVKLSSQGGRIIIGSRDSHDETLSLIDYEFSDNEIPNRPRSCPGGFQLHEFQCNVNDCAGPNFELTEGQARRGNFADCEFECSKIRDHLYVGGAAVASSLSTLQALEINRIINCSGAVVDNMFEDEPNFEYLKLDMVDGREDDILWFVSEVIQFIEKGRKTNRNTLLHCEKGISRSCSFAIAYGMWFSGTKLNDELRFVQAGRKICNPNTAFTCNLIEFGKLLYGDWSTSCLVFRCSHHLPHDMIRPVMKLCVDPSTRVLVRPDLTWFVPHGVYLIRPAGCRATRGEETGADDGSVFSVYIWIGRDASSLAISQARKLVGRMRGVFYRRAALVEEIQMGSETPNFLSYVESEVSKISDDPPPRPLYNDYWNDDLAETYDPAELRLRAEEHAMRGLGTGSTQPYVFQKSNFSNTQVDSEAVSTCSDLALSDDEDDSIFEMAEKPFINAQPTNPGFALSLGGVCRSLVMSALNTEVSDDESEDLFRNAVLSNSASITPVDSITPVSSSAPLSPPLDLKPILPPLGSHSVKDEFTLSTPSHSRRNQSGANSSGASARITGNKRFNVPSLVIGSPASSNNSLSGSGSGSESCSPSTTPSTSRSTVSSPRNEQKTTPITPHNFIGERARAMFSKATDSRKQATTPSSYILDRHHTYNKSFYMNSPRSTCSRSGDKLDSTRIPLDIGLARGATPVQDLLPASARILKKSKRGSASSDAWPSAGSANSGSIDSSPDRALSFPAEFSPRGVATMSKTKPKLFILEENSSLPTRWHWCHMKVYDDDDLLNDSIYLLLCSNLPHYIWIGSSVDWSSFAFVDELKGSAVVSTSNDDVDIRSRLALIANAVDNVELEWMEPRCISLQRSASETQEFWSNFCDGY